MFLHNPPHRHQPDADEVLFGVYTLKDCSEVFDWAQTQVSDTSRNESQRRTANHGPRVQVLPAAQGLKTNSDCSPAISVVGNRY